MPSGGARVKSGPPPDPNALRRERVADRSEWVTLPAEGRVGPTPPWPMSRPTQRESAMWERLWTLPQAVMWEKLNRADEVAMYVRRYMVAEKREATAASFTAVRQSADSLGLTTPGMRANRWKIGTPAKEAEQSSEPVVPFRPRVVADAVEGA